MIRRLCLCLCLCLALPLSACGGADRSATTPAPPTATDRPRATAPEASPPPPDAAGSKTGPASSPPPSGGGGGGAPPTAPPRGSGGAPPTGPTAGPGANAPGGGSEAVRVPATFRVLPGRLVPRVIQVPRFLAVAVTVASQDGRAHEVTVGTRPVHRLRVPPGGSASVRLAGLRAGRYPIAVDGRPRGAIVAGTDAVGP